MDSLVDRGFPYGLLGRPGVASSAKAGPPGDFSSKRSLDERLMRGAAAVSTTIPPREPARHGWAELLYLVGAVRRLAFDRNLPPPEALGRIRDAYRDYDRGGIELLVRMT
jgi:hypothetical protein